MPSYRSAGVRDIHYSTTGATGTWTAVGQEGDIKSDGGFNPSLITNELTNSKSYSGREWSPKFEILDWDNFATVDTLARDRSRRFFAFRMWDGTIYRTSVAIPCLVHENPTANRRDGDNGWILELNLAHTRGLETIASLT